MKKITESLFELSKRINPNYLLVNDPKHLVFYTLTTSYSIWDELLEEVGDIGFERLTKGMHIMEQAVLMENRGETSVVIIGKFIPDIGWINFNKGENCFHLSLDSALNIEK